jgi:hypothetical protein
VQTLCDPCANEKGVAEGLEHLPVVKELQTYFQRSCLGCRRKGNWSYHRPETRDRTDSKNALSDVDPGDARVENATEGVVGPGTDTS